MSDEQKYYTPAPEDIRIGFICQIDDEDDGWSDITFDSKMAQWLYPFVDRLRVPYLTAEQIEDEGWVKQINPAYFVRERNGFKYQLTAFHDEAQAMETNCPKCHVIIRINPDPWVIDHFQVFRGTIRCINDLRSISKLLGIETTKNNEI